MDLRDSQYVDNLCKRLEEESVLSPNDIARVLSLYIKAYNDNGIVRNVSLAYINGYDGKTLYGRYRRYFNQMYEMFIRNGLDERARHAVFKRVASRVSRVPTNVSSMKYLVRVVIEETHAHMKMARAAEARRGLLERFTSAVKKYMYLTYTLGFNEPSACAMSLVERHKIDKYVMSGDFPLILLPFLPDIESAIRKHYEHYEMQDAWEVLRGRYFDHASEYSNLAIEIKSSFKKTIRNFSDYFDKIYTDTYYKRMLQGNENSQ